MPSDGGPGNQAAAGLEGGRDLENFHRWEMSQRALVRPAPGAAPGPVAGPSPARRARTDVTARGWRRRGVRVTGNSVAR
jgi:hypothetical protein